MCNIEIVFLLVVHEDLAVSAQANRVFASNNPLNRVFKASQANAKRLKFFIRDMQCLYFKVRDWAWSVKSGLKRVETLNGDHMGNLLETFFEFERETSTKLAFSRLFAEF